MTRWRPRIRTVLLLVNLVILLMPVIGIQALNLYQNELVQRTETALISQGTVIRELFRGELIAGLKRAGIDLSGESYGLPVLPGFRERPQAPAGRYRPLFASLTMHGSTIRNEAAPAQAAWTLPDPVASLAALAVEPVIQRAQLNNLAGIRLLDFRGLVVGSTGSEKGQSLLGREEVRRALTGEVVKLMRRRVSESPRPSIKTISRGTRVRVWVALPVVDRDRVLGAVLLARTPLDLRKALYNNRYILMRYAVALVLIVVIVTVVTSTTISRPVEALIRQTTQVKEDPRLATIPLEKPGSRELQLLSRSVAEMAQTLQQRARYIEDFARNVSHEFKTPLASVKGTVELLRDHLDGMSQEERERFLGMLASDAARMEQLVERLLELARADVLKPGEDTVAPAAALGGLVDVYQERGATVSLADCSFLGDRRVRMSPATLTSLVTNLIDNALQHGGDGVHVGLYADWEPGEGGGPGRLILLVEDDGPGISAANQRRIFDSFFTTARDHGGTGLGLSIVKSLVEAHEGTVEVDSRTRGEAGDESSGTRVRITLPTVG